MGVRNWFYDNIVPDKMLNFMVQKRVAGLGIALMYHEVLPDNQGRSSWTVVQETSFVQQMFFMKEFFDLLSMDDAIERLSFNNETDQKPYAVITFDDGYSGNFKYVLPIIEQMKIPVTIFIASHAIESQQVYWYDKLIALLYSKDKIDINLQNYELGTYTLSPNRNEEKEWEEMDKLLSALKTLSPETRTEAVDNIILATKKIPSRLSMMTVEEVSILAKSPFVTIGGHSHCHNILTQLSEDKLFETLHVNRNKLQSWTDKKIVHFSFPNGNFNSRVVSAIKKTGFNSSVTTEKGYWVPGIDLMRLPRIGIGRFDSLSLLKARLANFC